MDLDCVTGQYWPHPVAMHYLPAAMAVWAALPKLLGSRLCHLIMRPDWVVHVW
jgi:hypothetical protein